MGFFRSNWLSSFIVTRVSSAAMRSAASSASRMRGVRSFRLPMGVATTYSLGMLASLSLENEWVPIKSRQAFC